MNEVIDYLNETTTKHNISGKVEVAAYQLGGNPSELANILKKDDSGNFYSLKCNFTEDMQACKTALETLNSTYHSTTFKE